MQLVFTVFLWIFNLFLIVAGITDVCESEGTFLLKTVFVVISLFSVFYLIFQTLYKFSCMEEYQNHIKNRCCKNCIHSVPNRGKDGQIYCYCDLSPEGVTKYPVRPDNQCGHFDYTDELKTEQIKIEAERMLKVKKRKE